MRLSTRGGLRQTVRRQLFRRGFDVQRFPRPQTHAGLLHRIVVGARVDTVIDVGANEGQFGRLVRAIGYEGLICSFEPLPEPFRVLNAAAVAEPPWICHRMALGRSAGSGTMHIPRESQLASFLQPADAFFAMGLPDSAVTSLEVDVATLDDVVGSDAAMAAGRRVFLKCDTQGFDLEVLAGATDTLARVVGIQLEVALRHIYDGSPGWDETLGMVGSHGFELAGLFPVQTDAQLRLLEVDAIFIRRDGGG